MHSCPRCGMECDCSGDWDDIHVMSDDWVWKNCTCECEQFQDEDNDDDYDESWNDDDPDGLYDNCPACGAEYDEIDREYQICSRCKYDAEKGKEVGNG